MALRSRQTSQQGAGQVRRHRHRTAARRPGRRGRGRPPHRHRLAAARQGRPALRVRARRGRRGPLDGERAGRRLDGPRAGRPGHRPPVAPLGRAGRRRLCAHGGAAAHPHAGRRHLGRAGARHPVPDGPPGQELGRGRLPLPARATGRTACRWATPRSAWTRRATRRSWCATPSAGSPRAARTRPASGRAGPTSTATAPTARYRSWRPRAAGWSSTPRPTPASCVFERAAARRRVPGAIEQARRRDPETGTVNGLATGEGGRVTFFLRDAKSGELRAWRGDGASRARIGGKGSGPVALLRNEIDGVDCTVLAQRDRRRPPGDSGLPDRAGGGRRHLDPDRRSRARAPRRCAGRRGPRGARRVHPRGPPADRPPAHRRAGPRPGGLAAGLTRSRAPRTT